MNTFLKYVEQMTQADTQPQMTQSDTQPQQSQPQQPAPQQQQQRQTQPQRSLGTFGSDILQNVAKIESSLKQANMLGGEDNDIVRSLNWIKEIGNQLSQYSNQQ